MTVEWLNLDASVYFTNNSDITVPMELQFAYTFLEIIVAIVAVIGNGMVILVFRQEKRLRRRTNYYIVSLAVADLLVGLLGIPFAIMASVGLPTNLHACLFTVSLLVVLCTISIFCLVAVSVDRYWAILHPMGYSRNVRTKTTIVIISLCWVAGAIVGFLPLFGWHADASDHISCFFVKVMDYNYLVFLYFATIITPSLIMAAFYAHIYRVVVKQLKQIVTMNPEGGGSKRKLSKKTSSQSKESSEVESSGSGGTMLRVLGAAQKREVKATQNLSIIVLFFMICWIPLYTINCIKAFCSECYIAATWTDFCIILSHLNSAVNPILYAYHLKDFRAALKSLIYKMFGLKESQPAENYYKPSLVSHCNRNLERRLSNQQTKLYVDSPVWLRQQQQDIAKVNTNSSRTLTFSPMIESTEPVDEESNEVHANKKREIWMISEVPSISESDLYQEGLAVISRNDSIHCESEEDVYDPSDNNTITVTQYDFLDNITDITFKDKHKSDSFSNYDSDNTLLGTNNNVVATQNNKNINSINKLPDNNLSIYSIENNNINEVFKPNDRLCEFEEKITDNLIEETRHGSSPKRRPLKSELTSQQSSNEVVNKNTIKDVEGFVPTRGSSDVLQYLDLHEHITSYYYGRTNYRLNNLSKR